MKGSELLKETDLMGLDYAQDVGRETEVQWPSDLWLISQGGWCHEPS